MTVGIAPMVSYRIDSKNVTVTSTVVLMKNSDDHPPPFYTWFTAAMVVRIVQIPQVIAA